MGKVHNDQQYGLMREDEAFNPKNTVPTVKMVVVVLCFGAVFATSGSGALKKIPFDHNCILQSGFLNFMFSENPIEICFLFQKGRDSDCTLD